MGVVWYISRLRAGKVVAAGPRGDALDRGGPMAPDEKDFFARLRRIEGQLERLANDFFLSESFCEATFGSLWRPPADVFETAGEVVVRVEVPGLHIEDITLTVHNETLVVRGVRREPAEQQKVVYHQLELHYGFFERVIPLPRYIRHQDAQAVYQDGFIVIKFPKCEEVVELSEIIHLRL